MGSVDLAFAADLRDRLGIKRAVETGTFRGVTARRLAGVFGEVVTIELSEEIHRSASQALADLPQVRAVQGHSAERLRDEANASVPTLFFLDGHWSVGNTAGEGDECPVMGELEAIGTGHPDDVILIDDARLFASSPPPPLHAEQWPQLLEVFDALRATHPDHVVTVLNDQVIAVPQAGKPALDVYGQRVQRVSPIVARYRALKDILETRLRR